MQIARRVFLGVLVVGLACGDDGAAPPVPSGMVVAGGGAQSGLPGVTLALPLRVTVTGSGGAPFAGARVTWAVTQGSATVNAPVDTTDVNGEASTTVTVGVVPGSITVTASATGVTSVNFSLTALNPCTVVTNLPNDTTVTGVLTNFDCAVFDGSSGPYFTDVYTLPLAVQTSLQISMNAATFDTYVDQYHTSGAFIAFNDDVDTTETNLNTRYRIIAAAGTYVVGASTILPTRTGSYSLIIAPHAGTLTGCGDDLHRPWVSRGVALTDSVETTDCVMTRQPGGGRAYSDRVVIVLTPARSLSASLSSAAFNPRLELWEITQPLGQPITPVFRSSADGVSGTATLNYTPTGGAVFRLEMTAVDTVQTGAYTLNLGAVTPNVADVIALPYAADKQVQRSRRVKVRPN